MQRRTGIQQAGKVLVRKNLPDDGLPNHEVRVFEENALYTRDAPAHQGEKWHYAVRRSESNRNPAHSPILVLFYASRSGSGITPDPGELGHELGVLGRGASEIEHGALMPGVNAHECPGIEPKTRKDGRVIQPVLADRALD
jgi:hypothetical protein